MDISEAMQIQNPRDLKRHPWEITRRNIIHFLLSREKKLPFIHIADIGCGDGFVLEYLVQKKTAIRFSAVDPSFNDHILNPLKSIPKASLVEFYKDIRELSLHNETVDCILLLDVLEHVSEDGQLIADIRRFAKIASGAKWMITVPAFQCLFSDHDKLLQHYRRYNLDQLSEVCKKAGLTIDKKGYFFFTLIPIRLVQKFVSKFYNTENRSTIQNWGGGKVMTALLKLTLWIDFKVSHGLSNIRINIPGLSCYCICH